MLLFTMFAVLILTLTFPDEHHTLGTAEAGGNVNNSAGVFTQFCIRTNIMANEHEYN